MIHLLIDNELNGSSQRFAYYNNLFIIFVHRRKSRQREEKQKKKEEGQESRGRIKEPVLKIWKYQNKLSKNQKGIC